ncbi:MAG TPA: DNA alkylation repair protein [Thermoanaerobaculia bacterium]|nr:DNA alkylation repair protein [Thermoanaerobaculia bacterium]
MPELREIRKRWSLAVRELDGDAVLDLARRSIADARFVACELVHFHRDAADKLDERRVMELGKGLASWADVDTFAMYIGGPAWKRGQISDALVAKWAGSKDRWWRRAALASTVTLNRKPVAPHNTERTVEICKALADDRDDMVVKALSWALRELSKADPQAVRAFIAQHEVAARVKREVANKLRTGLKTPRR